MRRLLSVLLVALSAAGCTTSASTASSATSASVTAPTPAATAETFSGTVDVGATDSHLFTVLLSGGQVNVILTAAGPPSTIYMGVGVGTYSGTTCTLLTGGSVVAQAAATAQLSGYLNAGSYCVAVSDAGNQTAPVTYSVTVSHY